MGMRFIRAAIALLVVVMLSSGPAAVGNGGAHARSSQTGDFDVPNGHFYAQAGGGGGLGFAIIDDSDARFWSEFQRLGGVPALGYPISHRFVWDGFLVQATQRVVMQWRPEVGQVYFVNVFDRLHELGFDDYLLNFRQVPRPMDTSADAGKPFEQVMRERIRLLLADPAIREAYRSVAGDPVQFNGLPTSPVTDMGNHFALRAQRVVIQHWKEDVPWARAGEVTFALGGDIAKEVGALPDKAALLPSAPPGLAPPAQPPRVVPPTPTASPSPSPTPAPPDGGADRYGVTFGASEFDPRVPRALELAGQAGVGWARIHLYWPRIEGTSGRFDWQAYDELVARVRAQGMEVLGVLAYVPEWNTTAPASETRAALREHYPPADYGAWERFAAAAVERYRNDIRQWEVWNEPDLKLFWGGTASEYARLLAASHTAIKGADPSARIALGGLSMGGSPGMLDPDFLSKILADPTNPAARHFDIVNFHHYGPQTEAKRRIDSLKAEMAKVGAADRPIWVTEVGYSSDPAFQPDRHYQGTQGQAQWLRDMLPYLQEQGASKVFWFQLFDHPGGGPSFTSHGLLDTNLTPKPAYDAYRDLIVSGR